MEIRHDEKTSRFVLELGDEPAYVGYEKKRDGVFDLVHTVVPPEHEGKGIASKLVAGVVAWARENDTMLIPSCPYVDSWLERHPDAMDVITED